jgi:hypothetical protein
MRLLGIKIGAFYVTDPIVGQVARKNLLKASKRPSLVV